MNDSHFIDEFSTEIPANEITNNYNVIDEEISFATKAKRTVDDKEAVVLDCTAVNDNSHTDDMRNDTNYQVTLTREEYERLLKGATLREQEKVDEISPKSTTILYEMLNDEQQPMRLQRKSDDELCNTPKREKNNDIFDHRTFSVTSFTMDSESIDRPLEQSQVEQMQMMPTTPQKQIMKSSINSPNPLVKTLSSEFEQRMASIKVSPAVTFNTQSPANVNNNNTPASPLQTQSQTQSNRTMSPIRSMAELSPQRKLNYSPVTVAVNNTNTYMDSNMDELDEECKIETPKLVSPSKLFAAVQDSPSISADKIRKESDEKWNRQIEFLHYEIASLQEKYESSLQTNAEMRNMLTEYERTLAQFIDARRARPDQHSTNEQLIQEKKKLELEIQTLQISFQNLHQRYEDIKGLHEQSRINEGTLRQSVQVLQQELATSIRNLDNTRKIYEERIEKSNMEALNTKASLENELSVTRAKLLKSELKINSLESSIEAKTRENSELMTICDELIHKMDKKI